ncbi:MAG: hypothetical protein OK455_09225 [Thaumarchaeota archaeon]|nr:hypothetical protein [Nitrososphaerota archaeon]
MEIDDSAALYYYTYHMVDWSTVLQAPSLIKCVSCGGTMMNVEPVRDKKGVVFEGLVCHGCKTVIWARRKET